MSQIIASTAEKRFIGEHYIVLRKLEQKDRMERGLLVLYDAILNRHGNSLNQGVTKTYRTDYAVSESKEYGIPADYFGRQDKPQLLSQISQPLYMFSPCLVVMARYTVDEGGHMQRNEHVPNHIGWEVKDYVDAIIRQDLGLYDCKNIQNYLQSLKAEK